MRLPPLAYWANQRRATSPTGKQHVDEGFPDRLQNPMAPNYRKPPTTPFPPKPCSNKRSSVKNEQAEHSPAAQKIPAVPKTAQPAAGLHTRKAATKKGRKQQAGTQQGHEQEECGGRNGCSGLDALQAAAAAVGEQDGLCNAAGVQAGIVHKTHAGRVSKKPIKGRKRLQKLDAPADEPAAVPAAAASGGHNGVANRQEMGQAHVNRNAAGASHQRGAGQARKDRNQTGRNQMKRHGSDVISDSQPGLGLLADVAEGPVPSSTQLYPDQPTQSQLAAPPHEQDVSSPPPRKQRSAKAPGPSTIAGTKRKLMEYETLHRPHRKPPVDSGCMQDKGNAPAPDPAGAAQTHYAEPAFHGEQQGASVSPAKPTLHKPSPSKLHGTGTFKAMRAAIGGDQEAKTIAAIAAGKGNAAAASVQQSAAAAGLGTGLDAMAGNQEAKMRAATAVAAAAAAVASVEGKAAAAGLGKGLDASNRANIALPLRAASASQAAKVIAAKAAVPRKQRRGGVKQPPGQPPAHAQVNAHSSSSAAALQAAVIPKADILSTQQLSAPQPAGPHGRTGLIAASSSDAALLRPPSPNQQALHSAQQPHAQPNPRNPTSSGTQTQTQTRTQTTAEEARSSAALTSGQQGLPCKSGAPAFMPSKQQVAANDGSGHQQQQHMLSQATGAQCQQVHLAQVSFVTEPIILHL